MLLSVIVGGRLGSAETVSATDGGSAAGTVGSCEGAPVSPWPTKEGLSVARTVGSWEGQELSVLVTVVGLVEGTSEGFGDSTRVGTTEGVSVGCSDGASELFTEMGDSVLGNQSVELVVLAGLQHKEIYRESLVWDTTTATIAHM